MADPVSASESNSFTITIDDTSPSILYSPFGDTFAAPDLSLGWSPFYADIGGIGGIINGSSNQLGGGTTLHATEADGASLSLKWNGEFAYSSLSSIAVQCAMDTGLVKPGLTCVSQAFIQYICEPDLSTASDT